MHPTTYYSNLENKGKSHVACSETNISKKSFDIDIVQSVGKNGFPLYSLKKGIPFGLLVLNDEDP
jgi:hypothetical protein